MPKKIEYPEGFTCPITHLIIQAPVKVDKQYFEKEALASWIEKNHSNPLTREPLTHEMLVVDTQHQAKIKAFINEHPEHRKDLYIDNATKKALESGIREGDIERVKNLIDKQHELLQENMDNGSTALIMASENGHCDIVEILLSSGAKANQTRMDDGNTALMVASADGHCDVVDTLLSSKADVNQARRTDGITALMMASAYGHRDIVGKLLAAGANVNQTCTNYGGTALMVASINGHYDTIEKLLAAGANVNQVCIDDGNTPLMCASNNVPLLELLYNNGATLTVKNKLYGYGVIYDAVQDGKFEKVKFLVEKGASIEQGRDDIRLSPLWLAVQQGQVAIVEYLLSQGANVHNNQYDQSATPLALAHSFKAYHTKKENARPDDIDEENNDADFINIVNEGNWDAIYEDDIDLILGIDKHNDTALMIAASKGYLKYAQGLLKAGTPVNSKNILGNTALHIAAQHGFEQVCKLLLKADAQLNTENNEKQTPLSMAIAFGQLQTTQTLLAAGAEITSSVCQLTKQHGFNEIYTLLNNQAKRLQPAGGRSLNTPTFSDTSNTHSPFSKC